MTRRVLMEDQFTSESRGHFNGMVTIETAAGPRELLRHNPNKANGLAGKMLVLFPTKKIQDRLPWPDHLENNWASLRATLFTIGLSTIDTCLLAADRPVTYFEYPPSVELRVNYQLELPGGVAEGSETGLTAGIREAVEELGLMRDDIVQWAPLVDFPAAPSAGSVVELYTTQVCLVKRTPPAPPAKEGIIPEHCHICPLLAIESYLRFQASSGVVIEHLAWEALCQLGLMLHGGGDAL